MKKLRQRKVTSLCQCFPESNQRIGWPYVTAGPGGEASATSGVSSILSSSTVKIAIELPWAPLRRVSVATSPGYPSQVRPDWPELFSGDMTVQHLEIVWKFFEVVFTIFRILLSSNFILWVHLETRFWCAKFWSCNTHHDAGCIELIRPIEAVGSTFTLRSAQIICQGMTLWSPGMTGNIVPNPILSWFVRQIHILLGVEEIESTLLVRSGKDQALFYCCID